MNWRELAAEEKFDAAETGMLGETENGVDMLPDGQLMASFYENWGHALGGDDEKCRKALNNWQQFASNATSGQGTARLLDLDRVLKKIESLKG